MSFGGVVANSANSRMRVNVSQTHSEAFRSIESETTALGERGFVEEAIRESELGKALSAHFLKYSDLYIDLSTGA